MKTKKDEIAVKQVGMNIITTVDGKPHTKMIKEKDERTSFIESLKTKVLIYNKKPSKAKKEEILIMVSKELVEKEKKTAKKKGIQKIIKKDKKTAKKGAKPKADKKSLVDEVKTAHENKELTETEVDELLAILRRKKESIKQEEAPKVGHRRSGEY